MKTVAKIISIVFHPILLPLYGVFCFFFCSPFALLPASIFYKWGVVLLTLSNTILIPLLAWLYLRYKNKITDYFLVARSERFPLYFASLIAYLIWFIALIKLYLFPIIAAALAAIVINILVMLVNMWWKISAHAAAWGGLFGVVCGISYAYSIFSLPLLCVLLLISLVVMIARLVLNAHTPWQLVAGFYLGSIVAFGIVVGYLVFM